MSERDDDSSDSGIDLSKRRWVAGLGVVGAAVVVAKLGNAAETTAADLPFPGEGAAHKVVYQFNKIDKDYQEHVLFSVGAVLRHYGDNVKIVISCFGPGIHILGKKPKRPVSKEIQSRVSSLSQYGVEFHACGNTMKSLQWVASDIVPFAKIIEVGAIDLLVLQEQGYSYVSW